MYVSVPKNYSGMAFSREKNAAVRPDVVHPSVANEKPMPTRLPPPIPAEAEEPRNCNQRRRRCYLSRLYR